MQPALRSVSQPAIGQPTHWRLPRFLGLFLLVLSLLGPTVTPAAAQAQGLQRTQWQMIRSEKNEFAAPSKDILNKSQMLDLAKLPNQNDPRWATAPLDNNGDIVYQPGSRVRCQAQLDFTYFQSIVTIPKGYQLNKVQVTIRSVDDYARVYVFNSKQTKLEGSFDAKTDLLPPNGQKGATFDIAVSKFTAGEANRIVIAQADNCGAGNTLLNAQVSFTGQDDTVAVVPVTTSARRIYVDTKAAGKLDGTTWIDAYKTLQDALTKATAGDEIWIAKGTYYPDEGKNRKDNDRTASFVIPAGVKLYGGFLGYIDAKSKGEVLLDQRSWVKNQTILSGDIDKNDVSSAAVADPAATIKGANSYHVVSLDGKTKPITAATRLDGLTITGGQANGAQPPNNAGGGLYCDAFAKGGECSPLLINVTFKGNIAGVNGGAIYNYGRGGKSNPTLINVIFSGNKAQYGGALYNYGGFGESSPTLINIVFVNNMADMWGGALLNQGEEGGKSNPTLLNVTFSGNSAKDSGGAIYNYGRAGTSKPVLTNVILWGNTAGKQGPSIFNQDNAAVTITASIVEKGVASIAGTSKPTADATNIIDSNPQFVSATQLQVKPGSPAIDKGDAAAFQKLAGDWNVYADTDIDGNLRIKAKNNSTAAQIDIGAYEVQ